MNRAYTGLALAISVTLFCGVVGVAPPRAPEAIAPAVPDPRATPTPNGVGRVVLDVEGGPAEVARFLSHTEVTWTEAGYRHRNALPLDRRETQLLCITPCVVDLPIGAHELVFKPQGGIRGANDTRPSSTATVVVHGGEPMVVRHAIGNETVSYSAGYALGWVSLFAGIGLTVMGGLILGLTAATKPSPGVPDRSSTFYTIGEVVGGIGLVLDVTGILAIVLNRPRHQEGATTVFTF
ncbi:hypothetical protein BH09MYX1_BH09MYX1_18770 [soil metagenome]